jgi:histidyl-tRNA synthetase
MACELSRSGIRTEMDFSGRSLKALMKRANRLNARFALIVGEAELESGSAVLRDMTNSEQEEIPLDEVSARLKNRITD